VIQHLSEFVYQELKKEHNILLVSLTNYGEKEIREELNKDSNKEVFVFKILSQFTTKRIAKFVLDELGYENQKMKSFHKKEINRLVNGLLHFEVVVDRVEDIQNAFVNGGGVSTKELDPKTFESKIQQGLFFVGETVDVHGPIGGYNITIALSSGFQAARKIGEEYHARTS
jgi:predicted flavoprotein YhiN